MEVLQTMALGLLVVFLDVGAGDYDWVADPIGWGLILLALYALREELPEGLALRTTGWVCLALAVLSWPPGGVGHLPESLGWVFSLPTLAFCFLICGSLLHLGLTDIAGRLQVLRVVFVALGVLPLLLYGYGLTWLEVPTAVLAVGANIALLFALWAASDLQPAGGTEVDR